jgi:eukaryotic-like serine/threonine-protein kinase
VPYHSFVFTWNTIMLSAGTLLQGRYRIIQELGSGGFATVFLAADERLNGRYVAVKAFDATRLPAADQVWASKSFQDEASVLAGLSHETIAAVTDFFQWVAWIAW